MKRTQKRMAAWLAMLAIALHAQWPVPAHAGSGGRTLLLPMCAMVGLVHEVEVPLGDSPFDNRSPTHFKHCNLCSFGAERLVAAPPNFVAMAQATPAGLPAPAYRALPSADPLAYSYAQPRAPPSVF